MAEMAPTTFPIVDTEPGSTSIYEDQSPNLELVELAHDRPPKLTAAEATYLLERGPYVARLRAKERLLETVLAYTCDPETAPFMDSRQPQLLQAEVTELTVLLEEFDSVRSSATVSNLVHLPNSEPNVPIQSKAAEGTIVLGDFGTAFSRPEDFLKKKDSAVCAETDPEIFFPEKGGSTREAKRICTEVCDLTDECLRYAVDNKERFGVWGGFSEIERRKIKRSS